MSYKMTEIPGTTDTFVENGHVMTRIRFQLPPGKFDLTKSFIKFSGRLPMQFGFKILGAVWRIDPEGKNHVVSNDFSIFTITCLENEVQYKLKEKMRSIGDAFTEGDKKGVFLPLGTTPYDKDIYNTTLHYEVIEYLNTRISRLMTFDFDSTWTKNPNKHKSHMYSRRIFVKMRL